MSRTHASWSRLPGPGKAAVACAALALLLLLIVVPGLIGALFTPDPAPTQGPVTAAGDSKERFEGYVAQLDGRSLFFVPAAPPPPPPSPARVDGGPRTPVKPSRYEGPALIAMIGNTAWFADGKTLTVGDDASGGMRLIAINPPWTATVEWSGVEFEVPLFDRDTVVQTTPPAVPKPEDKPAPSTAATPETPVQAPPPTTSAATEE